MKRAFTLIELIFVIIIIGVLAAVSIPKFMHLKQNAEMSNIVKVTTDATTMAVEGAVNMLDLEDNDIDSFELKDVLDLKGYNWAYVDPNNWHWGKYKFPKDAAPNNEVAIIAFIKDSGERVRVLRYRINCNNIEDDVLKEKCIDAIKDQDLADGTQDNKVEADISF